jgi:hypothetical protein
MGRWILAAVATVLAAGLGVAGLEAGVAIGHRYTTVHAAFVDKTRTQTRTETRTETRTATVTARPTVVNRPDVTVTRPFARPSTRTVTAPAPPPVTATVTVTETASSFSQ